MCGVYGYVCGVYGRVNAVTVGFKIVKYNKSFVEI